MMRRGFIKGGIANHDRPDRHDFIAIAGAHKGSPHLGVRSAPEI